MFSQEESKKLRQEFWTSFGKEYPVKWMLYDTKIKEIELKFSFNRKLAQVSLDIIDHDEFIRAYYFDKLESLQNVLSSQYLENVKYEVAYELPEGKTISRIYVEINGVSIHNRNDWPQVEEFLSRKMQKMQEFFIDFQDHIKN